MIPKLIKTTGEISAITPADGVSFKLDEVQKAVGGFVEVVYPPSKKGAILVINEDGKLDGLPINKIATALWKEHHPEYPDFIVGDAVLMPDEMFK